MCKICTPPGESVQSLYMTSPVSIRILQCKTFNLYPEIIISSTSDSWSVKYILFTTASALDFSMKLSAILSGKLSGLSAAVWFFIYPASALDFSTKSSAIPFLPSPGNLVGWVLLCDSVSPSYWGTGLIWNLFSCGSSRDLGSDDWWIRLLAPHSEHTVCRDMLTFLEEPNHGCLSTKNGLIVPVFDFQKWAELLLVPLIFLHAFLSL